MESFSPTPYWDFKQWSWGYGTKVPGSAPDRAQRPPGTIGRDQAFVEMLNHVRHDYSYLSPLVNTPLKPQQWAALLSFAYNLGDGNADNLVPLINAGDTAALGAKWKQYVYAGGVRNENLVVRRAKEWNLYNS